MIYKKNNYIIMKRYAIHVYGRVQDVGFRYTAISVAFKFNLTGWIKNLEDGSVYMEIQGNPEILDSFLNKLENSNRFIRIDNTLYKIIDTIDNESSFKIKY